MKITHCDICKNPASESNILIGLKTLEIFYAHFDICIECGEKIIKLLQTHKLLDNKLKIKAGKYKRSKYIKSHKR